MPGPQRQEPTLLELIAMGPTGGGEVEQAGPSKPIGIPDTFMPYVKPFEVSGPISPRQAERRAMIGSQAREPYYDGAEFGPRMLSPEARARLQGAMAQAGLIGKNDTYRLGVWDETSSKAYKKVLAYANQGGLDADTALQELLSSPMYDADGTQSGLEREPGKVSAVTSALTLEQQVQQAAERQLGRKLKRQEVTKFVSVFQGMEGQFNTTAQAMQDSAASTGEDATIQDIPSADVAADQFIESNYAQEAAGQDAYSYLGALRNLLGG